jgi:hypothetical protein
VEDKDHFLSRITARRRLWLGNTITEKKLVNAGSGIDVDSAGNVSAVVFIIKAAINNMKAGCLRVIKAV